MKVKARAKKIKMLALDIDGVLTDGRIIYDNQGNELKCFNVLDGMGLALLKKTPIKVVLISAKGSQAVLRRAKDIGAVEVRQEAQDKLAELKRIIAKYKISLDEVCFVGDDLADLPVLKRVGLAATVKGACAEAKKCAHYIAKRPGGEGAVREVIELILRAQNIWGRLIKLYTF
ncbi:MAG: HAD hydrolase family protein [Candidatus Omnitrophota bacterium]